MSVPPYHSIHQRRFDTSTPLGPVRSSRTARGQSPYPRSPGSTTTAPSNPSSHTSSFPECEENTSTYFIHQYLDENEPRQKNVRFDQLPRASTPGASPLSQAGTPGPSEAPQADDGSDTDSELDDKICKPPGEVGRPNRGGYNLRIALGWPDEKYEKVKTQINKLVDAKLDNTLPLSVQIAEKVQAVHDEAIAKFPHLDEYRDHWVINDFIKCRLKVRKAALHKVELEKIAAEKTKSKGGK